MARLVGEVEALLEKADRATQTALLSG